MCISGTFVLANQSADLLGQKLLVSKLKDNIKKEIVDLKCVKMCFCFVLDVLLSLTSVCKISLVAPISVKF